MSKKPISVVMLGASGAVGGESLKELLKSANIDKITILGRTPIPNITSESIDIEQFKIDIFDPNSYNNYISKHDLAICTLGVGEPSKVSKEDYITIDKIAVLTFANKCKDAGVKHFQLLSSVGASASSKSHYLKIKGELIDELQALSFDRLSIFQPSMILTPYNRYGFSQAMVLAIWPKLNFLLIGSAKKYRGIAVEKLGQAITLNSYNKNTGFEILQWNDFMNLCK